MSKVWFITGTVAASEPEPPGSTAGRRPRSRDRRNLDKVRNALRDVVSEKSCICPVGRFRRGAGENAVEEAVKRFGASTFGQQCGLMVFDK